MAQFPRFVIAAALIAGSGGLAQAQLHRRPSVTQDRFYALSEGRSSAVDRALAPSGAVAPSESHTVMGLRVPR